MATWRELSEDNIAAAKELLQNGRVRSCISRAYYAAYCSVTAVLTTKNVSFPYGWNNPAHEQVIRLIRDNLPLPALERRRLIKAMNYLRAGRETADYRPGYHGSANCRSGKCPLCAIGHRNNGECAMMKTQLEHLDAGLAARQVRSLLPSREVGGVVLRVVEEGYLRDGDWHVPVQPGSDPCDLGEVLETLAEIETALLLEHGLQITLDLLDPK